MVLKDKNRDCVVNRIECYDPLTKENVTHMSEKVTEVNNDLLPDQNIDCVVYACTSGTIAAGYENIKNKVKISKPNASLTTPSTAAIKALKKFNVKNLALFTPYSKKLNDEVIEYIEGEGFNVASNSYFGIESDADIGKVDQNYLYDVLSKVNVDGADALFISCTALPALTIIEKLEKKLNRIVLSSNQTLIWDTLQEFGNKEQIEGVGKVLRERFVSCNKAEYKNG